MPVTKPTIFISSTAIDLPQYRKAAIQACKKMGFEPIYMEDWLPDPRAAVETCLSKVDQADSYLGIFAHRYGFVPPGRTKSVTELEYDHAMKRGRSVYLFVVADDIPWLPKNMDDGEAKERLQRFKKRLARRHVFRRFRSPASFQEDVSALLKQIAAGPRPDDGPARKARTQASPPELYSVPPYILTNRFIGRRGELAELDSWARSEEPVFVCEAIGGQGKSALTWAWVQAGAKAAIPDLAGRFWWSFYETGATLEKMVREALAYVRGEDPDDLKQVPRDELARDLLSALKARPFLLVLDGLERVLTAYHRLEPGRLRDEEVKDDLRATISPRDGELLRQLVTVAPSKVLISTRLMPAAFENKAHRPIPGVRHRNLAGLQPDDAVELLRELGVTGTRAKVQDFLAHFEFHGLLVTVLAGRIAEYPPAPGKFDRWLADPQAGGGLHLGSLDLVQRRNHILRYALAGLAPEERLLLSRIALLGDAADYDTVAVLSPYLQPDPDGEEGETLPPTAGEVAQLHAALHNLRDRGLLSVNGEHATYDLHPVVRGFAADLLEEKERVGSYERIRDHFESLPPEDPDEATELADLKSTLQVYRALVGAGRLDQAFSVYRGSLSLALLVTLGAYSTLIELLAPLFPDGMDRLPRLEDPDDQGNAINELAIALDYLGRRGQALPLYERKIALNLTGVHWGNLAIGLRNYSTCLDRLSRLAASARASGTALRLSLALENEEQIAASQLDRMSLAVTFGDWTAAESAATEFAKSQIPQSTLYHPGDTERWHCRMALARGTLTAADVGRGLEVARTGKAAWNERRFLLLAAQLALEQGRFGDALEPLDQAMALAAKSGEPTVLDRALMARALASLGGKSEEAGALLAALEATEEPSWLLRNRGHLADAYLSLGEPKKAEPLALQAYRDAWADGPPYVFWWELQQARKLLERLGLPEPQLPPFDLAKVEPFPHEEEILAVIEDLERKKAEREAKAQSQRADTEAGHDPEREHLDKAEPPT